MNRQPPAPATVRGVADETAFERLVIEQLTQLQRGHAEIKAEIVAVGTVAQRTLEQATRTNGRVDALETERERVFERIDALEDRNQAADIASRARQQQRQEDREKVRGALDTAKAAWPLALAVLIGAGVIWGALWGLF